MYCNSIHSKTKDVLNDADHWIASGNELTMSAGWSCYCWLLGNRLDVEFSESKIANMIENVKKRFIIRQNERTSYLPLHDRAVQAAKEVSPVEIKEYDREG